MRKLTEYQMKILRQMVKGSFLCLERCGSKKPTENYKYGVRICSGKTGETIGKISYATWRALEKKQMLEQVIAEPRIGKWTYNSSDKARIEVLKELLMAGRELLADPNQQDFRVNRCLFYQATDFILEKDNV